MFRFSREQLSAYRERLVDRRAAAELAESSRLIETVLAHFRVLSPVKQWLESELFGVDMKGGKK
jgi:hypothetical protein